MLRRGFLVTVALFAAVLPSVALGQTPAWPERLVKVVVPFAPGGATDQTARVWAEKLSQAYGQQFQGDSKNRTVPGLTRDANRIL